MLMGTNFTQHGAVVSRVESGAHQHSGFLRATEIAPTNSIAETLRFHSLVSSKASQSPYHLQMQFLSGTDFNGSFGGATVHSLATKFDAK